MKPKHRVFCLDAQRLKMLFDTEKQANTFIKFNGHELCDNPEEKLSVYWCNTCGGYHITSHKYNPKYGQNTRELVKQYNEQCKNPLNVIIELKTILALHNNSIKFKKPLFKIRIKEVKYEAPNIYVMHYGDHIQFGYVKSKIDEVLDICQIKQLLNVVKRQLTQNEMKSNPKIIKVNPNQIMNPLNEDWAATAGFSSSQDFNCSGFSYEIKPLSFNLCQKGNDPLPEDKNKSFKFFVGDYVTGYCPYDGKKHEGMIKYLYWVPGSNEAVPKLVYVQDFKNEDTIPLEGSSVKPSLARYTPNELAQKDYFRSRDMELEHDYAFSKAPMTYESFDFNSNEKTLNEQYAYLNEERVMSKKFFDENFKIKARPGFHYKEYVDKTTGAYVTSVPSDDKPTGTMKFFAKHGISKVYNGFIGFSEKEQKWYGWSHRAIYGFGIGSKVKKGDCGYKGKSWTAKTLDDAKQMAKDFADAVS